MTDLLTPFVSILAYLITTAGAGAAASDLFTQLRAKWEVQPLGGRLGRAIDQALNTRAGARLTVFALSVFISAAAAAALAYATGEPIGPTVQKALAAALASQLYHLKDMLGQAPASAAPVFTMDEEAK